MLIKRRVQAVLFDFDGVLADTEHLHCDAFRAVAAHAGVPLSEHDYYQRYLGLPDRECLTALFAAAGRRRTAVELAALLRRKREEFARRMPEAALYPGAAAALRRLHEHFLLAIASGAFREEIAPILERAHVATLFCAVIGADDVHAGKPDPEPYLRALQAINAGQRRPISPAACVVIEDAPLGIRAARAAGMQCIAVTTHHEPAALADADAVIAAVSQLRAEDLM